MNAEPDKERLGERLVRAGHLHPDQLHIALHEQRLRPDRLGRILLRLGFVEASALRDTLAVQLDLPAIDLESLAPDPTLAKVLPEALARRHQVAPWAYQATPPCLKIAGADRPDLVTLDALRAQLAPGTAIEVYLASERAIEPCLDRLYGPRDPLAGLSGMAAPRAGSALDAALPGTSVIPLVDGILADAVQRGASDIHFEPEAGYLRLRYRIDGRLRQIRLLHQGSWPALCVRLKVLAGLDIAESRSPQDGRFTFTHQQRHIDIRASTMPTLHGENVVLRLLDRDKGILPLDRLGLPARQLTLLQDLLARPAGLILLTGPTGSGKTTTLYSLLNYLNDESVNIMTLEDPVEYPLPRLRQTSLGDGVRLDFASGIRALLRQDPDILLVGEIRDGETAHMALRAALTGHRVFATLHSPSALGALPRLIELGVSPALLAESLRGLLAQRLVRRLCPVCRVAVPQEPTSPATPRPAARPYAPRGCPACDHQGYRGRFPVLELVPVTPALADAIAAGSPPASLRALQAAHGHPTLAEAGWERVASGDTTWEEIARVIELEARPT